MRLPSILKVILNRYDFAVDAMGVYLVGCTLFASGLAMTSSPRNSRVMSDDINDHLTVDCSFAVGLCMEVDRNKYASGTLEFVCSIAVGMRACPPHLANGNALRMTGSQRVKWLLTGTHRTIY